MKELELKLKELNNIDFEAMSVTEMAKWFGVKKFADKKTAVKRCEAYREERILEIKAEIEFIKNGEQGGDDQEAAEKSKGESAVKSAGESAGKSAGKKAAVSKKGENIGNAANSAGVAASWLDPSVAAKRATRNGVTVNGAEYRSVLAAFTELGLPINKHIVFRGKLKVELQKDFEHDGKVYTFKIV